MSLIKKTMNFVKNVPLKDIPSKLIERNKAIGQRKKERAEKMAAISETEKAFGVDFGGYIPNAQMLGISPEECNGYEPSYDMPEIFAYLDIKAGDSLIDIGCGKGYAMYKFSEFPFSRIDGVELSEKLADIAESNLSKLFPDEKERFRIYRENALNFDKLDEYNYIYMYNPFPPEIVGQFAQRLKEAAMKSNRKITVIYQNPQKGSLIEKDGVFKLIMYADGTALFESV